MNHKRIRAAAGVIVAALLLAVAMTSVRLEGKQWAIGVLLCAGTGICIGLPDWKDHRITALLCIFYLGCVPYKIAQRMDITMYHTESWSQGGPDIAAVGMVLCVYLALFAVTRRTQAALGIGSVILMGILLAGYLFHVPQMPGRGLWFSRELRYSLLYLVLFTALGFRIRIPVENEHCPRWMPWVSAALVLLFCTVAAALGRWSGTGIVFALTRPRAAEDVGWYEGSATVQHAMGRTQEGETLTNSFEAFRTHYLEGQRVFEADVQITADGQMVLRHDWEQDLGQGEAFGWTGTYKPVPLAETFLHTPIEGQYTPLSLENWFRIMKRYPDIYWVTDTKYSEQVEEDFGLLVDTAKAADCEEVLDRVIVQIYYQDMYEQVMGVYPFKNVIFTLYYIGYQGPEETGGFCGSHHIPVLTMPDWCWNDSVREDLAGYDVRVYVHIVNDGTSAQELLEDGVSGIYTDDITNGAVLYWREKTGD